VEGIYQTIAVHYISGNSRHWKWKQWSIYQGQRCSKSKQTGHYNEWFRAKSNKLQLKDKFKKHAYSINHRWEMINNNIHESCMEKFYFRTYLEGDGFREAKNSIKWYFLYGYHHTILKELCEQHIKYEDIS